ncbi:probable chorismate pyruvate-lyase [Novimethylophilus kurashikiensis]|uniref:Probable chorismate pyruvate-lyase n=1 Tax=Novimethylophilus kurashikiensis TaxID=1825523 RepID=A0A2R5FAD2_9PROT|nr:BTAD domain-containing putative transcriptional regulator [Novimethylophilus kurashikiensis]GBG15157.1 probable chorismate pyruvate-lyase [Novimethylophilus kurashikiensis]
MVSELRKLKPTQRIRIQVFGAFLIEQDGQQLDMEGLGYSKPIELLKFLIAYGGHNVSTDFIVSKLWSDSDGDHAKNSFDGTLHRLRKILGCRDALVLNSGLLSINEKICWLDLWIFDRLAIEVEEELRNALSQEQMRDYTHKLLGIVRGPCLWLSSDSPWVYIIQEKTKTRFLRLVLGLGAALESAKQYDEAILLYSTALEYYPLAEEVCLKLVKARIEQGLCAEAIMVFRKFSHVLSESLGLGPSKAMQQVISGIMPAKS